jgi:hypothetical protein
MMDTDQDKLLAEARQATRQVKSGHYIKHEHMRAWLLSWDTDHELPAPRCICGKNHRESFMKSDRATRN